MAASVLIAVGEVDGLLERITERAARLELGTDMGPVTTAAAVERITAAIDEAERQGARVRLDGRGRRATGSGWWVGPTILDAVRPEMPAARDEIFGPVLSVLRVSHLEQALAIENANPYGNASTVYTTSGDVARRGCAASTSACRCRASPSASAAGTTPASATATSPAGTATVSGRGSARSRASGRCSATPPG
jgi:acyl-CoA reductase-like NAD-dependent aldehyde dehydrogenase